MHSDDQRRVFEGDFCTLPSPNVMLARLRYWSSVLPEVFLQPIP